MNREMDRYILVHLIDRQPVGAEMEFIPLHLTLVPWFYADRDEKALAEGVRDALDEFEPIHTTVLGEDKFGPEEDIDVNLIEKPQRLNELHTKLLGYVAMVSDEQPSPWVGEKWQPHVTHKRKIGDPPKARRTRRLYEGDQLTIDSVDLIASRHVQSERVIVERFSLE